jgi:hypothetical protein
MFLRNLLRNYQIEIATVFVFMAALSLLSFMTLVGCGPEGCGRWSASPLAMSWIVVAAFAVPGIFFAVVALRNAPQARKSGTITVMKS